MGRDRVAEWTDLRSGSGAQRTSKKLQEKLRWNATALRDEGVGSEVEGEH